MPASETTRVATVATTTNDALPEWMHELVISEQTWANGELTALVEITGTPLDAPLRGFLDPTSARIRNAAADEALEDHGYLRLAPWRRLTSDAPGVHQWTATVHPLDEPESLPDLSSLAVIVAGTVPGYQGLRDRAHLTAHRLIDREVATIERLTIPADPTWGVREDPRQLDTTQATTWLQRSGFRRISPWTAAYTELAAYPTVVEWHALAVPANSSTNPPNGRTAP